MNQEQQQQKDDPFVETTPPVEEEQKSITNNNTNDKKNPSNNSSSSSDDDDLEKSFTAQERERLFWNKAAEMDDELFDPFASVHRPKKNYNDQTTKYENTKNSKPSKMITSTTTSTTRPGSALNVGPVVSNKNIARRVAVAARHHHQEQEQQQQLHHHSPSPPSQHPTTSNYSPNHNHNNQLRHIPLRFQRPQSAAVTVLSSPSSSSSPRDQQQQQRNVEKPLVSLVVKKNPTHEIASPSNQQQNEHSFLDKTKNYVPGQRPLSADVSPKMSRFRHETSRNSPKRDPHSNSNVCNRIMDRESSRVPSLSPPPSRNSPEQQQQEEEMMIKQNSLLPRVEYLGGGKTSISRPGTAQSTTNNRSVVVFGEKSPSKSDNNNNISSSGSTNTTYCPYLVNPKRDDVVEISSAEIDYNRSSASSSPNPTYQSRRSLSNFTSSPYFSPSKNPNNKSCQRRDVIISQQNEQKLAMEIERGNLLQSKPKSLGLQLPLSLDSDKVFTEEQRNVHSLEVPPKTVDHKKLRYQLVSASPGVKFPSTLRSDLSKGINFSGGDDESRLKRRRESKHVVDTSEFSE